MRKREKIVEGLVDSFHKYGGINHLDGANLPSRDAVVEITRDLLRLVFPGFYDKDPIHSNQLTAYTSELVSSGGWRILHVDAVSILLARKDQNPPTLRPPPPSPWSHLAEGSFALQKGDHTRAEAGFQSALQQMPWLRPACYGLVESQMGRGAQHEARQALDRCQALFPDAAQRRRFHAVAE